MLLQTDGKEIRVLPAWPKEWDVEFKLNAPFNTVVSGSYDKGIKKVETIPSNREEDIISTNQ